MPSYLHPGVYIEEIPSGVKPIEGVSTSIAAFVGAANKGPAGEAVLIHSFDDYERTFGPIASTDDAMGLAVSAYYLNGGKDAYIARLVDSDPPASAASATVNDEATGNAAVLKFTAASVGQWGNQVYLRLTKAASDALSFDLEIGHLNSKGEFTADEEYSGLDMNTKSDSYVLSRVNGISRLVGVSLEAETDPAQPGYAYQSGKLTGGAMDPGDALFNDTMVDNMAMSVNIDGLGVKRINLGAKNDLGLGGTDNSGDGDLVAAAIQAAVRAMSVQQDDTYAKFSCGYDGANFKFVLTSGVSSSFSSVVVYDGDTSDQDLAQFLKLDAAAGPTAAHGSEKVIPMEVLGVTGQGEPLEDGMEGPPTSAEYRDFFGTVLKKIRDVSIIVLPGQSMPAQGGNPVIDEAIAHAEETRSRMVIVDPPPAFEMDQGAKVEGVGLTTSTYAVLYYPRVKTANPFYNPDIDPNVPPTVTIAPSALAAGIWAKIDGRRGVWKAPAGLETALLGVSGLEFDVGDGDQDQLNPLGVNCLRKMPGFGPVIWGTRTLATKADPEWRYVPIRRTAIMIEQSIYNGIQWAVFEPNNHLLWSSLRVNVGSFMDGLFRAGAFQGQKASDAYFVRCGLGDTMTQGDIDRGQVIVIVGFAPLKPAEFVIVRIQQKVAQQ